MTQSKRRATYEDLMEVPDHLVAEIIDGELVTSPRPASPHAWATSAIGQDLGGFSRHPSSPGGAGGWWILDEPELHLGSDVLVPDLAAWRQSRMPVVPNVAFFTLPPDWACEVVSPRTGRIDRSRKMAIYAQAGIGNVWLVDPLARTLEIYRLEDGRWFVVGVHGDQDMVRAEPFDTIDLAIARWWIDTTDAATG